ncbi:MAG: hypothetical protein BWX84_00884 [Verrucomicrobia bacterium ADurb.Bin118]|nr:MAG: hypothetical protein BWX84_00884 [Verrucomicrobia bacterium ADurb.Bin118]
MVHPGHRDRAGIDRVILPIQRRAVVQDFIEGQLNMRAVVTDRGKQDGRVGVAQDRQHRVAARDAILQITDGYRIGIAILGEVNGRNGVTEIVRLIDRIPVLIPLNEIRRRTADGTGKRDGLQLDDPLAHRLLRKRQRSLRRHGINLEHAKIGKVIGIVVVGRGRHGDGDFPGGIGDDIRHRHGCIHVVGRIQHGDGGGRARHRIFGFPIVVGGHPRGVERQRVLSRRVQPGQFELRIDVFFPRPDFGVAIQRIPGGIDRIRQRRHRAVFVGPIKRTDNDQVDRARVIPGGHQTGQHGIGRGAQGARDIVPIIVRIIRGRAARRRGAPAKINQIRLGLGHAARQHHA